MKTHQLKCEMWLDRPLDEVFPFFADAHNLDRITPPWLHFRILTPAPIPMHVGSIIEYKLRLHGFPIRWKTEIAQWEPPYFFVDQQIKGPYRLWRHEHTFEEKDGGTLIRDDVTYAVPGWFLEPLIHTWMVKADVQKIFDYRQEQIRNIFPAGEDVIRTS